MIDHQDLDRTLDLFELKSELLLDSILKRWRWRGIGIDLSAIREIKEVHIVGSCQPSAVHNRRLQRAD